MADKARELADSLPPSWNKPMWLQFTDWIDEQHITIPDDTFDFGLLVWQRLSKEISALKAEIEALENDGSEAVTRRLATITLFGREYALPKEVADEIERLRRTSGETS